MLLSALRAGLAAAVVLVLGAACSEGRGASSDPRPTASSPAGASPSSPAPFDPGPWAPLPALGRCGPQPPRLADQHFATLTLRSHGRVLPAVTIGSGRTVVVLVHQTDGGGFCGWLSFAARVAAVPGQAALAVDLCGYGQADCPPGSTAVGRQVDQVQVAIDEAVRRFHPRRLVLVGASMGGSLAVLTAARDRRLDAVVDLSGPDDWGGAAVHERAAAVRAPLLVAMADDEGPEAVMSARATADAAGPGSRFVGARSGHGYVLLEGADGRPTSLSEQVLAWIAGH